MAKEQTAGKIVRLSPAFEEGNLNQQPDGFIDYYNLSEGQADAVDSFMYAVSHGNPLPGKNKPSWTDDFGNKLPLSDYYQDGNYWHYHCGPSFASTKSYSMTYGLQLNIYGLTSAEIIHYIKEEDGSITVEGFMATHQPFPPSDDPNIPNPLFPDED